MEEKDQTLRICEFTLQHFPDNAYLLSRVRYRLGQLLSHPDDVPEASLAPPPPDLRRFVTTSQIMEQLLVPTLLLRRYRSACGKYVARKWRSRYGENRLYVERFVNGVSCNVAKYPIEKENRIRVWVAEYMQHRV